MGKIIFVLTVLFLFPLQILGVEDYDSEAMWSSGKASTVRAIKVSARANGYFGEPIEGAEPMIYAISLFAGQEITIVAEGEVKVGAEYLTGPNGLPIERNAIEGSFPRGYTPLEEQLLDRGRSYRSLPNIIEKVGALIGAFIPNNRASSKNFVAMDEDQIGKRKTGIRPSELFFIGDEMHFEAPSYGVLYLGINEPFVSNNSGSYTVIFR